MSVSCVWNESLCTNLSATAQLTRLSERDIQYDTALDQVCIPGFDANRVVFDNQGYTGDSIRKIARMVDMGFHSVHLDVWYDNMAQSWQLCPGVFPPNVTQSGNYNVTSLRDNSTVLCSPDATFGAFVAEIGEYLSGSDTDIASEILLITLHPRSIPKQIGRNSTRTVIPADSSINQTLVSSLGNRIFDPQDLSSLRKSGQISNVGTRRKGTKHSWPSLKYVVVTMKKRLLVSYIPEDDMVGNFFDLHDVAFKRHPFTPYGLIATNSSEYLLSEADQEFRAVVLDDKDHLRSQWSTARDSGFSPILNTSQTDSELISIMNSSSWMWAENQPSFATSTGPSDGEAEDNGRSACGMWTSEGLVAVNCTYRLHCLCRHKHDGFQWTINEDKSRYFDADCPDDYEFSLPRSSLEARYLHDTLQVGELWADINSLYIPNCWVSGGVQAICPYNVRQTDRNGVAYITVTAVASFCILCSMIYFEWERAFSPVRRYSPRQVVSVKEGVAE